MDESPAHSKALAIAPKFTALLSICGSLGIVLKVLFNESRRKKTMHRIVLGMSICDILASIWYFTGTWAIPAGTLSWFGDGETERIFWSAGDAEGVSCSFAGFFNQFAVATPLYNSTLAVYYLLVVNYGWRDSRSQRSSGSSISSRLDMPSLHRCLRSRPIFMDTWSGLAGSYPVNYST
eukprot:CAMPEP_0116084458 /NCGR_PEP_ID=MMETSP0327-20121206/3812_1 /TAXON_ID=44447 /ORGANISM="Pseudo-nitzschia delicatissima, Strain B596" /LENGTH=178 /DNA_ID=CAMNT_0003575403 /DNA_START=87 /DNA_END=619 /DNA_ORIENTATION=-